jgi:DNA topoisomerase I
LPGKPLAAALTLTRRRGVEELLAHRHCAAWHDVRSSDINAYLKQSLGERFTARDLRTWHAPVLAALALALSNRIARSRPASRRPISRAVAEVARYLGNTPEVARSSGIDHRAIDCTSRAVLSSRSSSSRSICSDERRTARTRLEAAVSRLVDEERRARRP